MTSGTRGARGPQLFGYRMPVRPWRLVSARSLTIGPISLPCAKAAGQAPVDKPQRLPGLRPIHSSTPETTPGNYPRQARRGASCAITMMGKHELHRACSRDAASASPGFPPRNGLSHRGQRGRAAFDMAICACCSGRLAAERAAYAERGLPGCHYHRMAGHRARERPRRKCGWASASAGAARLGNQPSPPPRR
jgi:hypothetical protein